MPAPRKRHQPPYLKLNVRPSRYLNISPSNSLTTLIVSGANLREFIAAYPDFASHLIHKLIRSVRQATESVKSLALEDVYARVVRLLGDLSDPLTDGRRLVRERLTQQDIAERVGASREMVSRIFKDLAAGGFVAVESGHITLLKKLPAAW